MSSNGLKLVLSNDTAIESVLSEIPFFSVGLVAFAVSTFFLVMKRINILGVYLFSSAIFAFGAAILDLSQILARGATNVEKGTGMDAVTAIINTREVGFSLSVGFRFLFFWSFIAERPRGEPPPTKLGDPRLYDPREHSHSASWKRWGYLGLALKYGLLFSSLAIPILQILWRIAVRKFSAVYMVETTMEIIISALFMLKMFLNIFLSPASTRSRSLLSYLAPLIALGINAGVAVGQLILFLFTETTLGRFLQAVELYILVLFVLIATFYGVPVRPPRSRSSKTESYFVSTEEKLFPVQSPKVQASYNYATPGEDVVRSGNSRSSRLSSWIVARGANNPRRPPSGVRWLVGPQDVETGLSPTQPSPRSTENLSPQVNVVEQDVFQSAPAPSLAIDTVVVPVNRPASTVGSVISRLPTPGVPEASQPMAETSSPDTARDKRPSTGFSFSYYGVDPGTRLSNVSFAPATANSRRFVTGGTDSPVYGLTGLVNPRGDDLSPVATSRISANSIEELLRQQNELDKSIATLRLFSTTANPAVFPSDGTGDSRSTLLTANGSRRTMATNRTFSSGSNPSEFSLSIFPDPPRPAEAEEMARASVVAPLRSKRITQVPRQEVLSEAPSEVALNSSFPQSAFGRDDRFNSAGTQYEITSFIGHLTNPGHRYTSSLPRNAPALSDVEDEEEPTIMTASSKQTVRPVFAQSGPDDTPRTSVQVEERLSPMSDRTVESRPPVSPNATTFTPAISSPLARNTLLKVPDAPIGPRRPLGRGPGLPSQPRLNISTPRAQPDIFNPAAFERPRTPPPTSSST